MPSMGQTPEDETVSVSNPNSLIEFTPSGKISYARKGSTLQIANAAEVSIGAPCGGERDLWQVQDNCETGCRIQAKESSIAAACALTVAAGANFVLYGPIESAEIVFPAIGMTDAAFAQLSIEDKAMPDPKHPIFRIA
jgi:tetrahydromethanopterin S-methyltransferase subunit H